MIDTQPVMTRAASEFPISRSWSNYRIARFRRQRCSNKQLFTFETRAGKPAASAAVMRLAARTLILQSRPAPLNPDDEYAAAFHPLRAQEECVVPPVCVAVELACV